MTPPVFRRILRRESHSPRTVAMVVAVTLLLLSLAYIGTELVLDLVSRPALLLEPAAAAQWIVGLPTAQPGWVIGIGGAAMAILGFVFVFLALTPGRLPKHQMRCGERAVLVDNGVIAASLAQHISDETGVARDDITVGVAHRTVDVTIRPAFGVPMDRDPVQALVRAELDNYQLIPSVKTKVRVARPKESELGT
ncbi:DUF6286 domain-containing protein [Microterricola viridarii]|uniref:DNA/RNA endonuclease G n=1 Tax=Microterricola viridarii TaxID=412690 RepID=A0A120I0G0_9MICO|nr:DUF6286 domain-containing protein [Microterricola viridarii]AMB58610.1 DNA/RNA endonuclease G [Microterricola viridarii]